VKKVKNQKHNKKQSKKTKTKQKTNPKLISFPSTTFIFYNFDTE